MTRKAIAQQRLLTTNELQLANAQAKDFPSLTLLKLIHANKNPRRARLFVLLTAFKLFFCEVEEQFQQIIKCLGLQVIKDIVFLNVFDTCLDDSMTAASASRHEQAFRRPR